MRKVVQALTNDYRGSGIIKGHDYVVTSIDGAWYALETLSGEELGNGQTIFRNDAFMHVVRIK